MIPSLIPALVPVLGGLLERILPDPKASDAAKLKLLELQQAGELAALDADLKITLAQVDVNREEAKSGNFMAATWRPMIGWMCAIGLSYAWVLQPVLAWVSAANGWTPPPPLDTETLFALVTQMLGLAGLRTVEKVRGVARSQV